MLSSSRLTDFLSVSVIFLSRNLLPVTADTCFSLHQSPADSSGSDLSKPFLLPCKHPLLTAEREREREREREGGGKITQSVHTAEAEVFLNVLNTTDPVKALTSILQQVRTFPCGGLLPLQELHEHQFSATAARRYGRRRQQQQQVKRQEKAVIIRTISQLEKHCLLLVYKSRQKSLHMLLPCS